MKIPAQDIILDWGGRRGRTISFLFLFFFKNLDKVDTRASPSLEKKKKKVQLDVADIRKLKTWQQSFWEGHRDLKE